MKNGLLCVLIWFVVSNSADVQEAFDFKNFDPVAYFKQGLALDSKGAVQKIDIEKYCDRLHQFLTLLFYERQLISLFCAVVPQIGPSERYEKDRFINGLSIDYYVPQGGSQGLQVVDVFELGKAKRPNEIGLLFIKSTEAIALALMINNVSMVTEVDKAERIAEFAKKEMENPANAEAAMIARHIFHDYLVSLMIRSFEEFTPALLRDWADMEMVQNPLPGLKQFRPLMPYMNLFFPEMVTPMRSIPLFSEIISTYADLMQAYANSGPLESTTGVRITPELKEVKRKMSTLLDKVQRYTGLLSEQYARVKNALGENRKIFIRNNNKKYALFSKEFLPKSIIEKSGITKDIIEKRLHDLPQYLDFSCIQDRLKPGKKGSERKKIDEKSGERTDPVSALNTIGSQSEINEQPKNISYATRVMNWLNPELTKGNSDHDILYHTFSFLADPIIKQSGRESTFITKERKHHKTYHLAGEIEYLSGQKQGAKELYVFVNTYDPSGVLYHRGIEPIRKDENFFQDFFSKSYGKNMEYPESGTQPITAAANNRDKIMAENDYSVVLYDARNDVKITLLKPLEGLSYN